MESPFSCDPEVMGGTPVFTGTRVPVQTLLDYLEAGDTIDEFIEGFPSVSREQVISFLEQAKDQLVTFDIAVMVLRARSNRLTELPPLVPALLTAIPIARRGDVTSIGETSSTR
ncbi:MAG: DUF433 domain-containing protein [Chloroflexi bacterium]|nr:DUF433 domain-containing protein [Chloroflexota bacterium]